MRTETRFIRIIVLATLAAAFLAVAANAANDLKFHAAPGPEPVIGRYLVTLDSSVTVDLAASSAEALAQAYGGQLEPYKSSDIRQFAIAMLPARARGLSADARVHDVVEIARREDDTMAPPPSTPPAHGSRHIVPIASDSSSSGTYLYDGSGNIKTIGNDTFFYDTVGRLKQAVVQGSQESYDYDPFGNRKSSVRAAGAAGCVGGCDLPVNPDQHTNHVAEAVYDEGGSVLSINGAAYSYDGIGMVTAADVGSDHRNYLYTADDERIAVRQGTSWTWTVRDQTAKVLREFTSLETSASPLTLSQHTWSKDYVWRDGLLLASVNATVSGTTTYHYHLDHLGTPRLITDQNHILIGKHTYYPFGAEMDLTPRENPVELMKFTGHERDAVSSDNNTLDYMHARFFNGSSARFISLDPALGDPHQPQTWNRYAYGVNNPVNRTDPTGRCTEFIICLNYGRGAFEYTETMTVAAKAAPPPQTFAESFVQNQEIITQQIIDSNPRLSSQMQSGRGEEVYPQMMVALPAALSMVQGTGTEIAQSVVLSGHGGYDAANGLMTLPEGTSLTVYTQPGGSITDALGNAVETGADLRPFTNEMAGARSYLPGSQVPNLTLHPPTGLTIMGNPVTVTGPTTLNNLVGANMGNVRWAACLTGMPCN